MTSSANETTGEMKILAVDIETTPHFVTTFDLWNTNINLANVLEPTRMMCFAAKWVGENGTAPAFYSEYQHGTEYMIKMAHDLLTEADAILTYNGKKFDVPHLNREFLLAGLAPPAPYAHIDLYWTIRQQFKLASNKLDYALKVLGLEGKVQNPQGLWLDCIQGKPEAWDQMREYNIRDITALEDLYSCVLPWIKQHPSRVTAGQHACPTCGAHDLRREGVRRTLARVYQRYQCRACGAWSQDSVSSSSATIKQSGF